MNGVFTRAALRRIRADALFELAVDHEHGRASQLDFALCDEHIACVERVGLGGHIAEEPVHQGLQPLIGADASGLRCSTWLRHGPRRGGIRHVMT